MELDRKLIVIYKKMCKDAEPLEQGEIEYVLYKLLNANMSKQNQNLLAKMAREEVIKENELAESKIFLEELDKIKTGVSGIITRSAYDEFYKHIQSSLWYIKCKVSPFTLFQEWSDVDEYSKEPYLTICYFRQLLTGSC